MFRALRPIVQLAALAWQFAALAWLGAAPVHAPPAGTVPVGAHRPLGPRSAHPPGTVPVGAHVTLATRWLDPAETDAEITPFMIFYALHDALVKPMPAGINAPSLAESWTMSKDGRVWEFVLRKGTRFHNGDPVTAAHVKFSLEGCWGP